MLSRFPRLGIKAARAKLVCEGCPNNNERKAKIIGIIQGISVPRITPTELILPDSFIPWKFRNVAPQK